MQSTSLFVVCIYKAIIVRDQFNPRFQQVACVVCLHLPPPWLILYVYMTFFFLLLLLFLRTNVSVGLFSLAKS